MCAHDVCVWITCIQCIAKDLTEPRLLLWYLLVNDLHAFPPVIEYFPTVLHTVSNQKLDGRKAREGG